MKKSSTEFKQMQRERIFQVKPWEKSTGAKTVEGKARSKMNALKISPELNELIKEMKILMQQQKEIQSIMAI